MVLLPEVQNARKLPGSAFSPPQSLGFSYTSAERESDRWTDRLSPASSVSQRCQTTRASSVFSVLSQDLHVAAAAACAVWELLLEDAGMSIFYFNSCVFIFMFL